MTTIKAFNKYFFTNDERFNKFTMWDLWSKNPAYEELYGLTSDMISYEDDTLNDYAYDMLCEYGFIVADNEELYDMVVAYFVDLLKDYIDYEYNSADYEPIDKEYEDEFASDEYAWDNWYNTDRCPMRE